MTDPTAALAAGLTGRYTIERLLGRGGMAAVYLARDLKHNRPVALKVLLPDPESPLRLDRFQREVQLAARLQHPHILPVHDSGETAGHLWFSMPYVEGESLRERLQREHRLPLDEALRITREAAQALQYAHDQGIVHRDIKPENLLLTKDGSTLVADFGIARAVAGDERLTGTGASIGTPTYMSPEQASGEPQTDPRSDVYSLGAVLFEMLAGTPPYTGATAAAIVAKWFTEPIPSVRALRPEVPAAVDLAIQRALSQSAADRFGSTAELLQALQGASPASTPVAGAPARSVPGTPGQRRRWTAIAAGLGVLVAGAVVTWRYVRANADTAPKVLAVLPFENLGDSADGYFAEGIANELRSRLSELHGVQVIARGSSNQYRGTTKSPQEIARELGVGYVLTATVQWNKAPGAPNRIRVIPELVEITPGQTPRARWQQPFDAALTDVFAVQADIATKVADALGVVLGDSARRRLAVKPTDNLAAYDEFLKGEAAAQGMKAGQPDLRRAIAFYERAVSLDSTFAQAWSQLSRARTSLYSNGVPDAVLGQAARTAAERARALAPGDPLTYLAAGDLLSSVNPIDSRGAMAAYEQGLRLAPENVDLLSAAATASGGRPWDDRARQLEHALQLDPRSFTVARRLATVRIFLRQYSAADSSVERAIALEPTNPQMVLLKLLIAVGRGDLPAARAAVDAAAHRIDPATLYAFLATYQDLYWVLDDDQQRQVLALPPAAFDDDRGSWGIVRTELYHLRGDPTRAVAYADSARLALEAQSHAAPEDGQRHVILGLALAYLGRKAEAIAEGREGVARLPIGQDAFFGPYVQLQLARIYILTGEPDQALDLLEPLLRIPFYISPGWLRVDPTFDPLRSNPRFRRLVEGTT